MHRAHHRWTDTEKDPYNSKRGFFYAHIGWLFYKTLRIDTKVLDVSDLKGNNLVRWQNKNFVWMGVFMGFVFPSLVAGLLWGDYKGGFLVAGVLRGLFVLHSTWCVNSLAHFSFTNLFSFMSNKPYDHTLTPVDSILTALVTNGEGYHNFHHEYPNDYRNAIFWYQYDPTKWLIKFLSYFNITKNLNTFPNAEIERALLDMKIRELEQQKAKTNYGVNVNTLKVMSHEDILD